MDYISIDSSQDIIEHYGIKGMKWGRRKLFYEKRSYKKDPLVGKGSLTLKDYGAARRKTGLSRLDFGFNPKHSKRAFAELDNMRNLKDDIRLLDYSIQRPNGDGSHNPEKYGKYLKGKDWKEFNKRMSYHKSIKNPNSLNYEKYSKWADNMHKMRDLGMKGMVIRRDQKVNDYRKALGYD